MLRYVVVVFEVGVHFFVCCDGDIRQNKRKEEKEIENSEVVTLFIRYVVNLGNETKQR